MVTENCKKIEPVVVKLRSKTKYTTFSEHGVCIYVCVFVNCVDQLQMCVILL